MHFAAGFAPAQHQFVVFGSLPVDSGIRIHNRNRKFFGQRSAPVLFLGDVFEPTATVDDEVLAGDETGEI